MRARSFIGIGALAYGAFLVATLPASLVGSRVEGWTGGQLRLANVKGTLWTGAATPTVRVPGGGEVTLDRATWSWQPLALFRGQLAIDVGATLGQLAGTATVARTPLAWEARRVSIQGPLASVASLHPLLSAWQPAGSIAIASDSFRYDGKSFAGRVQSDWRDTSLSLSPITPLGAWRLEVAAENGPAKVTLATQRGPLRLSGQGSLAPNGTLAFTGEARAESGREADLASLLAAIGPKRADGAHAFSLP